MIEPINIPNTDENTSEEAIEKESPEDSIKDYKIIIDMLHEMDDQYKILEEQTKHLITEEYGYNEGIIDAILKYNKNDIVNLDESEIRDFMITYANKDKVIQIYDKSKEELINDMEIIKDATLVLLSAKVEKDNLKAESSDILKDYFNYMSSDKVKAARLKRLETFKDLLKTETDEVKKAKIERMVNDMEASMSFSFLQERFEKYGKKEIQNIEEGFFNEKKGSYILERYNSKISKFGYNPEVFKYFFNIEENFLGENYAPFNNLFLYVYIRTVAYSDPYNKTDKLFVQSLTGALANLIYHKFESMGNEQQFISVIKAVDDRFIDSRDKFVESNTTYKDHPARIKVDKENEERHRSAIIEKLKDFSITDFTEDMSTKELENLLNTKIDEITNTQLDEFNRKDSTSDDEIDESGHGDNVVENEDGSIDILPTIHSTNTDNSN